MRKRLLLALTLLCVGGLCGCNNTKETDSTTSLDGTTMESNITDNEATETKEDNTNKEHKKRSYRWQNTVAEGGYDRSFTAENPTVQEIIELNDDNLEDAILATASYYLTLNYQKQTTYNTELSAEDFFNQIEQKFYLNDVATGIEESDSKIFYQSTEYSADGTKMYICKMRCNKGGNGTVLARVEVTADNIIKYRGDNTVLVALNTACNVYTPNFTYYSMVPYDITSEEMWALSTKVADEIAAKQIPEGDVLKTMVQAAGQLFSSNEIPFHCLVIDDNESDNYVDNGVITSNYETNYNKKMEYWVEDNAPMFTEVYGMKLKPIIYICEKPEDPDIDLLDMRVGNMWTTYNLTGQYVTIDERKQFLLDYKGITCADVREFEY